MKGCLIGIAIFIVLVMGSAVLIWSQRDTIMAGLENAFEIPDYGREEYIKPRYGDHLQSILAAANNAGSLFQFGAAIETMNLPEEIIYVGIKQGEEAIDIIKKYDWNGRSLISSGDYGAGTLSRGQQEWPVMTYSKEGGWPFMEQFHVFIEYHGDAEQVRPQ